MKIVEELTREALLEMQETGLPIFTSREHDFLSRYAMCSFLGIPYSHATNRPETALEMNRVAQDIVAKLDVTVANPRTDLADLANEKARRLNPILDALGIDTVDVDDNDPIPALHNIKVSGLEVLDATTTGVGYKLKRRIGEVGRFQRERDELYEKFGDAAMFVYGSVLTSDTPSDIDTMVVTGSFTEELYREVAHSHDPNRDPIPMTSVIVPSLYLVAYILSETSTKFAEDSTRLINGSLNVPVADEGHYRTLVLHDFASKVIRARNVLTPKGMNGCDGIINRINNRVKIPRFSYQDLHPYFPTLKEPTVERFDELPSRETFAESLVNVNLQLNRMVDAAYSLMCR